MSGQVRGAYAYAYANADTLDQVSDATKVEEERLLERERK